MPPGLFYGVLISLTHKKILLAHKSFRFSSIYTVVDDNANIAILVIMQVSDDGLG